MPVINVQQSLSEQCSAGTSVKIVTVFQMSLKLVRGDAGAQFSNRDNKHLASYESDIYKKGNAVNKNKTLI